MSLNFTPKQWRFFDSEDKRLNFLSGSVRSGKTYISLWKFAMDVMQSPKNYEFIMVGKTVTTLKRNCLVLLQNLVGKKNFYYTISSKTGKLFNHTIYLEGANDERSEEKIRGMTLGGAYTDEITLFPQSFVNMLLSRLSMPNAKLFATCNPDSPDHFIKVNYIDKTDLDCSVWNFVLTDNTFLSDKYIENISKEYTGVFYQRFILGQWVRAEGLIYTDFANNTQDYILSDDFNYNNIITLNIGVDFGGNKSATTFVCTGFTRRFESVIILENERHEEELSPDKLEKIYCDFVKKCTKLYNKAINTYADSAEQILIRGLRNATRINALRTQVFNAKKMEVLERIRLIQKLMGQGRFKIKSNCKSVIKAFQTAVWDDKKDNERLDVSPNLIDDLDATEYSIESHYKELNDFILRE